MQVYIVYEVDSVEQGISAVFDSYEKALAYKKEHEKLWGYYIIYEEEVK